MLNQIKNIKKRVEKLLIEKPTNRDSDYKIIANLWVRQLGQEKVKTMTAMELLEHFAAGQLLNPESIRRVRQKIQEQQPELRGKSYKARKQHATEVRQEIKSV